MKLNHDCVRDVLLFIESSHLYDELTIDDFTSDPQFSKYSYEDIIYAIMRLHGKNYIHILEEFELGGSCITIQNLTWDGHEFLDNIRDKDVWEKSKRLVSTLASASLPVINQTAANLIKKMIDHS